MKKIIGLAFFSLYWLASFGISMELHYCLGRLTSLRVGLGIEKVDCCGKKKMKARCCHEKEIKIEKITDQHFPLTSTWVAAHTHYTTDRSNHDFRLPAFGKGSGVHSPGHVTSTDPPGSPLYLFIKVFRI